MGKDKGKENNLQLSLDDFVDAEGKLDAEVLNIEEEKKGVPFESNSDAIIKMYKAGVTVPQIQKEFKISSGSIYSLLAREGIPLRLGKHNTKANQRLESMTDMEKKSLIYDYTNGMPMKDIYEKYNVNKHTCYVIIDEAKVARRTGAEPSGVDGVHTPANRLPSDPNPMIEIEEEVLELNKQKSERELTIRVSFKDVDKIVLINTD